LKKNFFAKRARLLGTEKWKIVIGNQARILLGLYNINRRYM